MPLSYCTLRHLHQKFGVLEKYSSWSVGVQAQFGRLIIYSMLCLRQYKANAPSKDLFNVINYDS